MMNLVVLSTTRLGLFCKTALAQHSALQYVHNIVPLCAAHSIMCGHHSMACCVAWVHPDVCWHATELAGGSTSHALAWGIHSVLTGQKQHATLCPISTIEKRTRHAHVHPGAALALTAGTMKRLTVEVEGWNKSLSNLFIGWDAMDMYACLYAGCRSCWQSGGYGRRCESKAVLRTNDKRDQGTHNTRVAQHLLSPCRHNKGVCPVSRLGVTFPPSGQWYGRHSPPATKR